MVSAIIDTDIGDDVDDAFALALALRSPELRIVGVTTVAGPVERRARLAQTLLVAGGRADIPVAAGSSAMSDGRPGPHRFSHGPVVALESALPPLWAGEVGDLIEARGQRLEVRGDEVRGAGHEAKGVVLRPLAPRTSHPAPLLIICLGPLTNLALALCADPTLAGRIRVVAMAGKLGLPYPDWNLRCDPAAARTVLASRTPITLVGMHVTMDAKLSRGEMAQLFDTRTALAVMLSRCVLAWRTPQRRMPILHDALTLAVACDPTLATLAPRRILVGPYGFSVALPYGPPNALVCQAIDLPRWRALVGERLLA